MTTLLHFGATSRSRSLAHRAALVAENLLLRQQVVVPRRQVRRPRFRPFDRWLLATLAGRFVYLLTAVLVVRPAKLSSVAPPGSAMPGGGNHVGRRGRPPIDIDLRKLIRRMWRDNATWGKNHDLRRVGQAWVPRLAANRSPNTGRQG